MNRRVEDRHERDTRHSMEKSGKTTIDLPDLKVKCRDEQAVKNWEKGRRDNPTPRADIENAKENASLVQQQLQYGYDRLVLSDTTLFLKENPPTFINRKRGSCRWLFPQTRWASRQYNEHHK